MNHVCRIFWGGAACYWKAVATSAYEFPGWAPLMWGRTLLYFLFFFHAHLSLAVAQTTGSEARPGLPRLIQQAIQNHPDIAAARSERRATEFEIDAARNQFYPTPSAQLRQDHKDASTSVIALTQPLWTGGKLTAGLNAANSRAESANTAIEEARYTLALRVVTAWAAYRQAQGRENAQAEGVELLKIYTESVSRRIQGGASAEVDRELVAARLAQAQSDLSAARAARRNATVQLAQLLGQQPRAEDLAAAVPARTAGDLADDPLPAIDELIRLASDYSPALRRIDSNLEAAHFDADKKRASLWPTLNLRAEHQRSNANTVGTTINDNRVMLALEYTPDAGLATNANIDAAQARIVSQQESREAARRNLIEKVQGDYEEWQASRERAQSLQRTLEANAAVLASYDRLLVAGKRSWLDVLNIARELTSARAAQSDIEAQKTAARYRLHLHVGELPGISSGQ